MTETGTVASKLRAAIQQIDSLPPNSGVAPEHLILARKILLDYIEQIQGNPECIPFSDFNRVSRLVIEYWPLSLPAGEAVLAAEQAMRKLTAK